MTEGELLQNLLLIIGGIVGTGIVSVIIYHYKKKSECFTTLKQTAYDSKEDISLIKKFLSIQARMIDETTKKLHPEEALELEILAKEMFDD